MKTVHSIMLVLCLLALSTGAVYAQGGYEIVLTDLGTLGGSFTSSKAINDAGTVVGFSATSTGGRHAFVWHRNDGMIDLGTFDPAFAYCWATAINQRDQVIGSCGMRHFVRPPAHAFLWEKGVMIDLGTLGGDLSIPSAINERSQVVGHSTTTTGQNHAFLWENGVMIDLGTLGGYSSNAIAINNQGQVVGTSTTSTGESHAFLWEGGLMTDLGTLGGYISYVADINERGQVIGDSIDALGNHHAFLWEKGSMMDLGTLGGPTSYASAINEHGQIVGVSEIDYNEQHAFLWENGDMVDLGVLSYSPCPICRVHSDASDINDSGQIVGTSNFIGVLWDKGNIIDLGSVSTINGINNRGQILSNDRYIITIMPAN